MASLSEAWPAEVPMNFHGSEPPPKVSVPVCSLPRLEAEDVRSATLLGSLSKT